jgi:hypothetical protein
MLTIITTVDTEGFHGDSPFERFILGRVDGAAEDWGVFRILELCRRYSAGVTFFVDVYESLFWGEERFCDLTRRLSDMAADVQLHTHPEFRGPRDTAGKLTAAERIIGIEAQKGERIRGPMTALSYEQQRLFLKAGMDMLVRWTGTMPVAHRAGGYAINEDTVRALRETGISLDSSMNVSHTNSKVTWSRNAVIARDGLVEFPVTVQNYTFGRHYARLFKTDLNSCSLGELLAYVDYAVEHGLALMNLFLHSYSLVRFDRSFKWFDPDPAQARKLERFLAIVRRRHDVRLMSCAEALARYRIAPGEFAGTDGVPERNVVPMLLRAGLRKARRYSESRLRGQSRAN